MTHHPITERDFFYVLQDNYDEHIELAIPFYRLMHEEIARYLPHRDRPLRALDLGCGTGKTSAMILRRFPDATVRAIDLFDVMLNHARSRLQPFASQVEYVKGDFREISLGDGYDVCVTVLAFHHSTDKEKKEMFARVFESLLPDGRFIMIDWTKFRNPFVQSLAAEIAWEHAEKSVPDSEIVGEWLVHWRDKNIPDTVQEILSWLRQTGFAYSDCVARYYGMAMIYAEKKP